MVNRKKVLITGGSGLLGLNWANHIRNEYKVVLGINNRNVSIENIDTVLLQLDKKDEVSAIFDKIRPDIVVHAAGMTSVEDCEKEPHKAWQVNVKMAENVAETCFQLHSKLVHISTDHLFNGKRSMYTEQDTPSPLNIYGKTKAEAELKVLSACPGSLIIRTNFYGWGPTYRKSFSDFVITHLSNQQLITLFDDVYYTPIEVTALVECVHELVDKEAEGVFNVVGDKRLSKYEFGIRLARRFGLERSLIQRGLISQNTKMVNRPKDMSLSNRKISSFLNRKIGNIDEHFNRLFAEHFKTKEIQNL